MAEDAGLHAAIEACYHAFAGFPPPRTLEASPLRDAKAILRSLLSAPLPALDGEAIGPYAGWAMTTVGNGDDYCHFVPRILELSIFDPGWLGFEPVIIANKLILAGWRDWPADRRSAVLGFFDAAFARARVQHSEKEESASLWLAALATLGEPVEPLFAAWRAEPSPNAGLQIALFLQREGKPLFRHDAVGGPFWEEVDLDARQALARLLRSEETQALLRALPTRIAEQDHWLVDSALAEVARKF